MRNRDGLKLLDYTSFTEDVQGQIARRRLRLGESEAEVVALLPAIELALADNGFVYEHCALNGSAAGQLAVVRRKGLLYRIGISGAARWEAAGTKPNLGIDAQWGGTDAARGNTLGRLPLDHGTDFDDVDAMLAGAAAGFDVDREANAKEASDVR